MEKLSQHIFGLMTTEAGEGLFHISKQFWRKSPFATPTKGSSSLNNFVTEALNLDFPRFDGKDDLTI